MSEYRSEEFLSSSIDRYGDAVYRLALCKMQSQADAEDVFQEVFIRLFKDRTEFKDDEHMKAWLLRVTAQRCNDMHRLAKRRTTSDLREYENIPAEIAEDYSHLWEAVGQLSDNQRMTVHLYYGEGYQTDEIAQILGCEFSTVRTWLYRARQQLKTLMEEDNYEK